MTLREERDMRLKIVKDALFWRKRLHELSRPKVSSEYTPALAFLYLGRLQSSLYAIKVIKGIE